MVDELFSPEEQRTFQILDKWKVKSLEGFEKLGEIGLIDSSSILNLLTDLSSGEFNYKVELVTPKASKEDLIINIGSKFPENLAKLKKTYEDGISMGIRYWLWIVLYPLDHTLLTKVINTLERHKNVKSS